MRRSLLAICLAALALPGAARAGTPDPPDLGAELTSCVTGVAVASRAATFRGSMPTIARASVLAMRFDLERFRGTSWRPVTASTFGRWERSVPGAAGFVYDKRIEQLAAPASYRATVRFRWSDAAGHVVRELRRRTPTCRQPERRPDLQPVTIVPGAARPDGTVTYVVTVRNTGVTVAPPFRLGLSVAGVALVPQPVPVLGAGADATVSFDGPACRPGEGLRAAADADALVDEADEGDNALVQRCVAA